MIYLKDKRIETSYQYICGDKYTIITIKPKYTIIKVN